MSQTIPCTPPPHLTHVGLKVTPVDDDGDDDDSDDDNDDDGQCP